MSKATPFEEVLNEIQDFWNSEEDVFGRICSTIFETTRYTSYTLISEEADCSPNSAKKHLDRLAELGLVERQIKNTTTCYRLNTTYIEWRVLIYIVEKYSLDEIIERVKALEARQEELSDQNRDVPSIAHASDVQANESIGSRMQAANSLESINRRIRLYELARQVLQNDGHLVSEPL